MGRLFRKKYLSNLSMIIPRKTTPKTYKMWATRLNIVRNKRRSPGFMDIGLSYTSEMVVHKKPGFYNPESSTDDGG